MRKQLTPEQKKQEKAKFAKLIDKVFDYDIKNPFAGQVVEPEPDKKPAKKK